MLVRLREATNVQNIKINMRVIIEGGAAHRMQEWAVAGCLVFMPELPGISLLEVSFGVSFINMSGFPFRIISQ